MKCEFCAAVFRPSRANGGGCPACGRKPLEQRAELRKKDATIRLFFATALFLCTCVLIAVGWNIEAKQRLEVVVSGSRAENGGYLIRGSIRNFSNEALPVPSLVFVLMDASGEPLERIETPAPFAKIGPKTDREWEKKIAPKAPGAEKISARFAE